MATRTETDEQVRQLVDRAVRAAVPPSEMVERRVRPESEHTWSAPAPLAGFRAAQQVRRLVEAHMYRHLVGLRGEGTSWRQIVDLLEIPWSNEYSRVERAYELIAGPAGEYLSRPNVYWYCGGPLGCGQHITDHGPYNGHPADNETGHAENCQRLAAEIAAHEHEQDEADERNRVMDEAYAQLAEHSFERATADRARYVRSHGGRYLGWSTSETLAVALVLEDDTEMNRHGYSTRRAAIDRVFGGSANPPPNVDAWLRLVRAAATGGTGR